MKKRHTLCALSGCNEKSDTEVCLCHEHWAATPAPLRDAFIAAKADRDAVAIGTAVDRIQHWHESIRTTWKQEDFRAQHGMGLVWESVRDARGRQQDERMRDGWIAKLFESLTDAQQDSMVAIERGFRMLTAGMGTKNISVEAMMMLRGRGTGTSSDYLVGDYIAWSRECQVRRFFPAIALAVIVEGHTCNEVDAMYRQRRGEARANLSRCLNTFCDLQGWPRPMDP